MHSVFAGPVLLLAMLALNLALIRLTAISQWQGFIVALNSINTPWLAILVIVLGMTFEVVCKTYGLNSESAAGVIGAGVGLLTGQGLANASHAAQDAAARAAQPPTV